MKIVGIIDGAISVRLPPEDFTPTQPAPAQDVLNLIQETFGFLNVNPGQPGQPTVFQQGAMRSGDGPAVAVNSLIVLANGCVVSAPNTSLALAAFEALKERLTERFAYRYPDDIAKIAHKSAVVVQFDRADSGDARGINSALSSYNFAANRQSFIRRVSFSNANIEAEHQTMVVQPSVIDQIENCDFVVERRIGVPLRENRYYSIAPMTTEQHFSFLERFENLIFGD